MSRALYVPEPLERRFALAELDGTVDTWVEGWGLGRRGLRVIAEACLGVTLQRLRGRGDLVRTALPGLPRTGPGVRNAAFPGGFHVYERCRTAPRRNRNLGVFHRVWRAIQVLEALERKLEASEGKHE